MKSKITKNAKSAIPQELGRVLVILCDGWRMRFNSFGFTVEDGILYVRSAGHQYPSGWNGTVPGFSVASFPIDRLRGWFFEDSLIEDQK